jgi:hypothetical protein
MTASACNWRIFPALRRGEILKGSAAAKSEDIPDELHPGIEYAAHVFRVSGTNTA